MHCKYLFLFKLLFLILIGCHAGEKNKSSEEPPKKEPAPSLDLDKKTKNEKSNVHKDIITQTILTEINTELNELNEPKTVETKIWHEKPAGDKPKAVIILLHGLNLKPEKMSDWSKILSSHDAYVMNFALYGHTGDLNHMRDVTPEIWRAQFRDVAKIAKNKAQEYGVPINFLGYSLGALVGLEWLAGNDKDFFEKMTLLAPALSLAWYLKYTPKVGSIFDRSVLVPSLGPERYRANIQGTSIAAYLSLFDLKKSLEEKKYKNANNQTLIIVDKNDELVSSEGLSKVIKKYNLSEWNLKFIDNNFAYEHYKNRHLLADEAAIGKDLWITISQMVLKNFGL